MSKNQNRKQGPDLLGEGETGSAGRVAVAANP